MSRSSNVAFLLSTFALTGWVALAAPQALAQTKDQQNCINALNKAGAKVAATQGKDNSKCVKDAGAGKLINPSVDICATADNKGKVAKAEGKTGDAQTKKCSSPFPTFAYTDPTTINDAATGEEIALLQDVFGDPVDPAILTDKAGAKCQANVAKTYEKLGKTRIKDFLTCKKNGLKDGSITNATLLEPCIDDDLKGKVDKAATKLTDTITKSCAGVTLATAFPGCSAEAGSDAALSACIARNVECRACLTVNAMDDLDIDCDLHDNGLGDDSCSVCEANPAVPPSGDPLCPNSGELTLYSKLSNIGCANNGDCTFPRTCNTTLGLCTTVADLDSGWNGAGHDSDINDQVTTRGFLQCDGPASPGCGECSVVGIDPSGGNCRCANNILVKCDEPFASDCDDCDGAICNCYFGAPFPLAAQGTPVCVANRFSQDITGTANVDLGSGAITANLRTQVFLGLSTDLPCPVCGGKCSDDDSGCIFDSDCTGLATCVQDTPGDGNRDGLCVYDPDFHTDNGVACDVDGSNSSFPAIIGNTSGGSGGGGYSIDCQPEVGKNISGAGLKISLSQSTGTESLAFGVDCDGAGVGTDLCPCLTCSKDQTVPCSSDSQCASQGGSCDLYNNPTSFDCNTNADCSSVDLGTCTAIGNTRCSLAFGHPCTTNADCLGQAVGNCAVSTCSSKGGAAGGFPEPNFCSDDTCTDQGGGEGECLAGPDFKYCDALVRSDGTGINACNTNADCSGGYGNCTILDPADCFLDPIESYGSPDPDFPVAGAVFCIPPTSNAGVNSSAGLPGPGRVLSQAAATTYCESDPGTEYTPGGIPACP